MVHFLVGLGALTLPLNGWAGRISFIANGTSLVKKFSNTTGPNQNYLLTLQNQISLSMQTKLMFSLEDSLANRTQQQASDLVKKMTATSGQKCLESLEKLNQVGLWAKMFSALLIGMEGWYSTKCKLTWKLKGTKYSRMYCQLQVSTHRTSDLEFGLLLTPTTREEVQDLDKFKKRMEKYPNGTTMPNLATQINSMMLPTPAAVDYKQTTLCESQRERSTLPGMMVKMFKTPKASDKNMHWKTEKWKGDDLGSQINEMLGTRSHLSPLFVMEMMGFPTDWTLLPFLNGETNQSKQEATQ